MMAAILNSAIFDSAICTKIKLTLFSNSLILNCHLDSAICTKKLHLIHSDSTWWWQPSWILPSWIHHFAHFEKTSLIHSDSTWWWWQPSWSLPCWIQTLPSWIQTSCYLFSDSLKNTLTPFDSDSNWFWLKLIHSDLTWWWQPSWILPSWIQPFCTKINFTLVHSDSTWWWQPSWSLPCWIQTLPSWIQTPFYLLSDSIKNTLTPLWLWLKLIQSDSNSFILIQLDDGSHLEFCHLGFCHFYSPHKLKTSLIHSDSTWWWQPFEVCHVGFRHCHLGFRHLVIFSSDSLKNTLTPLWLWLKLIQSDSNSFILT